MLQEGVTVRRTTVGDASERFLVDTGELPGGERIRLA